jgi:hypothetical protein
MNSQTPNFETWRRRSVTALIVAFGLYVMFLLVKRSEILLEESRGHLMPLAVFRLLGPTTRAEILLISTIGLAIFCYLYSLSRRPAAPFSGQDPILHMARMSPLRLASISVGWSGLWPLLAINTIFQVMVLYTRNPIAMVISHAAFYAMLVWLAAYILRHEIRGRYGVLLHRVAWTFLWRAIAVTLLANFALLLAVERELLFRSLRVIEWLALKSLTVLFLSVGLGWAAHRCLLGHSRESKSGRLEERET